MQIKKTNQLAAQSGVKFVVYAEPGAGKTTLIKTLPGPVLMLSVESGTLALRDVSIDVLEVNTYEELMEAYQYIVEHKAEYKSIALDSVSEIAERILENAKKVKSGWDAYSMMADSIIGLLWKFQKMPGMNIYVSAKMERVQDDSGLLMYGPDLPGKKAKNELPYIFDEVFRLHVLKDKQTGDTYRKLQTQPDGKSLAKDRSGCLAPAENPDLGAIIEKILEGVHNGQ